MILIYEERQQPNHGSLNQSHIKKIGALVELKQYCYGDRFEKNLEEAFQPVLPWPGKRIEFRIQVMHFMVLPQNFALMKATVIPIEKEIADEQTQEEGPDDGGNRFPITNT